MTPTTFATGYLYAGMGWTTVNEAAVPILSAKHTHEELHDMPIVDKSTLLLMANNEIMLDLLEAGEFERAQARRRLADLGGEGLRRQGGQPRRRRGVEVGQERQAASRADRRLQEGHAGADHRGLAQIVDELGLPHPMHLHCNNLGVPGNVTTTIETMKVLEGHRAHLAHLQFHAYGGDDWGTMRSEAAAIAEYFNTHTNLTCRRRRRPVRQRRDDHRRRPVAAPALPAHRAQVGQPRRRERDRLRHRAVRLQATSNLVNAVQWAVGLELLLLIDDPWRVYLTTDHPNGGGFWRYPEILRLLMDVEFRKEQVKKLPAEAQKRIVLADLDREYTLSEIAIITSAGPARALGLTQKGHLGVGADADVTIYQREAGRAGVMFAYPRYVLKGGEVVVEEGEIRAIVEGREFIVQPDVDETIEEFLRPLFQKLYTMSFENYPTEIERLARPADRAVHAVGRRTGAIGPA